MNTNRINEERIEHERQRPLDWWDVLTRPMPSGTLVRENEDVDWSARWIEHFGTSERRLRTRDESTPGGCAV